MKVQKVLKNWQVEADNIAVARPKISGCPRSKRDSGTVPSQQVTASPGM